MTELETKIIEKYIDKVDNLENEVRSLQEQNQEIIRAYNDLIQRMNPPAVTNE